VICKKGMEVILMTKNWKVCLVFVISLLIILPCSALAEDASSAPAMSITSGSATDSNLNVIPPSNNVNQETSTPGVPPQGVPDPSAPSIQFTPPPVNPSATDQSDADPGKIPPAFDLTSEGVQNLAENIQKNQESTPLPMRPTKGFFSSAWFLIILIILMISAYLIYVALSEGKWPLHKNNETPSKKTKKSKK
jgi:hypothetical protein